MVHTVAVTLTIGGFPNTTSAALIRGVAVVAGLFDRIYDYRIYWALDGRDRWLRLDAANVGHIRRHAVTPFDVEGIAGRPHVIIPAETIKGEKRWKLFGKTASNRYLVVVFTIRRRRFRTVTAYE